MRTFIITIMGALLLGACATGYEPQPNFARDDLYCWHLDNGGVWRVRGPADQCTDNTQRATPVLLETGR